MLDQFRLSVDDKSEHCENGERWAYSYYGELTGSHHQATQGTYLQLLRSPLPPNWGLTTPTQNLRR